MLLIPVLSFGQLQVSTQEASKKVVEWKKPGGLYLQVSMKKISDKDTLYMITFWNALYATTWSYRSFSINGLNNYRQLIGILDTMLQEKDKSKEVNIKTFNVGLTIRWVGNGLKILVDDPAYEIPGSVFEINEKVVKKLNVL
jgi:hypothetical protein